jgi:hypothetical protein
MIWVMMHKERKENIHGMQASDVQLKIEMIENKWYMNRREATPQ